MKRGFIAMLLIISFLPARFALAADKNKELVGSWKCEVNSAPYEYAKSTITFSEKDGKLNGVVKFDNGYQVNIKTVTFEKDALTLEMYVDYNYIKVTAKLEKNKITGTVSTPEGAMNLVATKK